MIPVNDPKIDTKNRRRKRLFINSILVIFLLLVLKSVCDVYSSPLLNISEISPTIELKCTGTPQERRALASLGDSVSPDRWREMMLCMMKRERTLMGMFALHISKSGGTSLCDIFTKEQCFQTPKAYKKWNCWHPKMTTKEVDFKPQWIRSSAAEPYNLQHLSYPARKHWIVLDPYTPEPTCEHVRMYMAQFKQKIAMSENWLPLGGVCQDDFMNLITIRNPMDRLVSQYSHILRVCKKINAKNSTRCDPLIVKPISNNSRSFFNLTNWMTHFDIVSDNYLVRSLSSREGYQMPFGHMDAFIHSALENLRKFDWILIIDSNNKFERSTDTLLKVGLGLNSTLPKNNSKPNSTKESLSDESFKILADWNQLDYEIWLEAQKLHELDYQSLTYMRKYAHDLFQIWNQRRGRDSCCGRFCTNATNINLF
jgi:hypothetical protein